MMAKQITSLQQQLALVFQQRKVLLQQHTDTTTHLEQANEDIALLQSLIAENVVLQMQVHHKSE